MTGSLNKSYSWPIIIEEERLHYLSEMITERFQSVYYKIETIDGASYNLSTIEDVLSYSNPQPRRIIKVGIFGNKEKDTIKIYPDISIFLFDMGKYDKSCILSLNNLEDQEITFLSNRVDEFVKGTRAPYWWLHSNAVYWIVGIMLYLIAIALFYAHHGKEQLAHSMNNSLFWFGLVCLSFVSSCLALL